MPGGNEFGLSVTGLDPERKRFLHVEFHNLTGRGGGPDADGDDQARFHRAPAPSDSELGQLLDTFIRRITRTVVRAGALVEDPEHPWLDLKPAGALEQLAGAAVR